MTLSARSSQYERVQVFANEQKVQPERKSRYQLHLPYTIVLRLGWVGRKAWSTSSLRNRSPENRSIGYCIIARNYDLEQPDDVLQGFETVIFGQDQRVVNRSVPSRCLSI